MSNKVMTRYSYSSTSFKLLRTQSEEYTYKKILNEHQYNYKTGTKKHNTAHQTDLTGNILKILERSTNCGLSGTPDQLDRKFKYDPINRLLEATGRENQGASDTDLWDNTSRTGSGGNPSPSALQAYTRKYSYDKMGNILQLKQTVGNTFTRNFHYDTISTNNLLHSIKKADDITNYSSFTFDVNGNKLTSGISRNYVWDYADQLKAYLNQTGTTQPNTYAQYLYSGGQRVKKLVRNSGGNTETTVYIDGIFEHRYNSNANAQSVVHVGGIATVRTGHSFDGMPATTYQLNNHLGSVNFRLSDTGSILDREEYYPFGDSSVRTWANGSKRYRYVGKEKDAESGLYYYGARYYSAWTCRFISVDPLAREYSQLTSYNYAGNKPINYYDIDGMQSSEDEGDIHKEIESTSSTNSDNDGTSPEDNIVFSPNGDRIYNIALNREWDYGIYNSELDGFELHKINAEDGISADELDALSTFSAIQGQDEWVESQSEKIYDKNYADWSMISMWGGVPSWNESEQQKKATEAATEEYWTNIFKHSGNTMYSDSVFGIERPKRDDSIEPVYIEFELLLFFATAGGGNALRAGFRGLSKLGKQALNYAGKFEIRYLATANLGPGMIKIVRSSKSLLKTARLPHTGKIRFVPRPQDIKNGALLRSNGGYVDKFGNVWVKPRGRIIGELHWDVQLSATGKKMVGWLSNSKHHINVTLKGTIAH